MIEGYSEVKSKSYIHSYLPGSGTFTNAPENLPSLTTLYGLFLVIIPKLRVCVNIAPSRYADVSCTQYTY